MWKEMIRLYSFSGLIKNEYLKIIKKTSGKVMLGVILIMILGFPILLKFINNQIVSAMNVPSMAEQDVDYYKNRAADLSADSPYYDLKIELLNFMAQSGTADSENSGRTLTPDEEYYVYDWRVPAVFSALTSTDKQEIQKLTILCKTDDWRGYAKYKLSSGEVSDGEKWKLNYLLDHDMPMGSNDKDAILVEKIAEKTDAAKYAEGAQKVQTEEKISKLKYQLENKIYFDTSESGSIETLGTSEVSFWDIYMMTPVLVPFFGYMMIVIAGGIIASEFSQGTIKFLLINPVKRWKILTAKYITVVSLGALLLVVLAVLSVPMIGLLFGFKNMDASYLYVKGGEVYQLNSFFAVMRSYLLSSVELIVFITLSFAISAVARSSAAAVGFGIGLLTIGKSLSSILSDLGLDWARYIIFSNTDLLTIAAGKSPFPEHTVAFAVTNIAVYMFVFLLTAWDGFTKKSL